MSEREMAVRLLDSVPEYKLGYVIAYLQGITADDKADDAFCEQLAKEYEADPDKGNFISFKDLAAECGVDLDEI